MVFLTCAASVRWPFRCATIRMPAISGFSGSWSLQVSQTTLYRKEGGDPLPDESRWLPLSAAEPPDCLVPKDGSAPKHCVWFKIQGHREGYPFLADMDKVNDPEGGSEGAPGVRVPRQLLRCGHQEAGRSCASFARDTNASLHVM